MSDTISLEQIENEFSKLNKKNESKVAKEVTNEIYDDTIIYREIPFITRQNAFHLSTDLNKTIKLNFEL